MPIHDWSRVEAGLFHDFHQAWTIELRNALNSGGLPPGFFALAEQIVSGPIPDVVTLKRRPAQADLYAHKANCIVIKHRLGDVVAVIEIVSPGNKRSSHALRSFVEKAYELLRQGINLLVVDMFPPSPRDPQGIHKAIWDEICIEAFAPPPEKPLTVAAYSAGTPQSAYVEPVAVGDPLPELPIFLNPDTYVPAPLETTYRATWDKCPDVLKEMVEHGGD
jgi:hypothetical protein